MTKLTAAIVGSGNIGTDLLYKLCRSPLVEPRYMVGIDPQSEGLRRAGQLGVEASSEGVDWLLSRRDLPNILFEATSARVHLENAQRYERAGIRAIDLTPAALGPFVVPTVNLIQHLTASNVNLVTCGGQATVPIIHAVSTAAPVSYSEVVVSIASTSAGPGTRANIDEFTRTTAKATEDLGGSQLGKAIIILNPATPPLLMRDTIFCLVEPTADESAITASIESTVREVQSYVPGYRLLIEPQFDSVTHPRNGIRVAVLVEIEGSGDFLPKYAGNLDVMTASAIKVAEEMALHSASVTI